jgi:hypothetical protein
MANSKQQRFQVGGVELMPATVWQGFWEVGKRMFATSIKPSEVVKYDEYMIGEVLPCDPVLPGMIGKLTNAFAGAGWTVVGPASTAARASSLLENADGGEGGFILWRHAPRATLCATLAALSRWPESFPRMCP